MCLTSKHNLKEKFKLLKKSGAYVPPKKNKFKT